MPPVRRLIAVQLAVLAVAGLATVARFPVWALVDERAHYAYVQEVAEEGRLPWLRRDLISPEIQAIDDGTYPGPPRTDPRSRGLAGFSYEAFQPPLYYAVAAPAFRVPVDHPDKVRVLRALGLVLLAATVWLLWLLAVRAAGRSRAAAAPLFAGAMTFVLWPGVVVRGVTVSNAVLEGVLVLAALVLLWDADDRRDPRRLAAAGAVVGLAMLARLSAVVLVPVLVWVVWRWARRGNGARTAALALVLPALVLAPWLASNVDRYDALTASAIVREMQEPLLNPTGHDYGIGDLDERHAVLLNGVLAEEWWAQFLSTAKRRIRDVVMALLFAVPLGLALWRRPRDPARAVGLLAAPFALAVALMTAGLLAGNWDFFYPRYLYAVLPAFGLFLAVAVRDALGERALVPAAWVVTVALGALWAGLATVTPFTA